MKSDSACPVPEVITPSVSSWKERQPTSANCVVTVLVAMRNCINSSVLKRNNEMETQT